MKRNLFVFIMLLAAAVLPSTVLGQTLADVPGEVVYWRISPSSRFWPAANRIYTTSPSIVKLPNGNYVIAFNLFGDSLSPAADASGTTYLYRSSDQGQTWVNLTPSPMMDMKRGSLFVYNNVLYFWGYTAAPGQIVIRKSTDNGSTWTTPNSATDGLLNTGTQHGTPHNPVIHNGRLWTAVTGKRVMSVSTTRDFLDASRWAGPSSAANTDNGPLGAGLTITEAQIVASPAQGVVVLPKIENYPYTVLIRATGNQTVANPTDADWVDLPGGDKKFGAAYDLVSGKFYILSNPVLPTHYGYSEPWNLIRNTAAMLSSKDLVHWDVEQLFLYSPNIGYEGFQYLNFDFDGNDLIIASRTAFDITDEPGVDNRPPRGHDSNLITFHRIPNFRNAVPNQFLKISGGQVLRQEQTQHKAAPLGSFVLGSSFEGAPLGTVNGLAQGSNGTVFVREQAGRVLRFDALGNFIEVTTATNGLTFVTDKLEPVTQPERGERSWIKTGSGDWNTMDHWYYWGRPDTADEVANFGSAIGANAAITLNQAISLKGFRFRSPHRYTVSGTGSLTLSNAAGTALAEAQQGTQYLSVAVQLGGHALLQASPGADLRFNNGLNVAGCTVTVASAGLVRVGSSLAMNNGTLVIENTNGLVFITGTTGSFSGTLDWRPDPGTVFNPGDTFQLLGNIDAMQVQGAFASVLLPDPGPGLLWNTNTLYTTGLISVTNVPNTPPSLTSPGDQTTAVGQTLQLQLVATDNDLPAQTLTFALLAGPDGATLGSASGLFQWRPPVAAAGTNHLVRVQVTDDGQPPLADEKEFTITVPPFERPTLQAGQWGTGGFSLEVLGSVGPDYVIQVSTNLQVWTTLETVLSPALPFTWTDAEAAAFEHRFYRVLPSP
jgi:hypothetical protein